jgi:PKD repeat protein
MIPGRTELFVDGVSQGTTAPAAAQGYSGYWRVGADNLNGWPNQPASAAMVGTIAEAAVYPVQLAAADVQWHYNLASGNKAPSAAFTSACTSLTCALDGSASTDTDGTIAELAWDFGDGQTDVGTKPSHTYTEAGTFQVRLTVTDNLGSSTSVTQPVTVTAPNQAPVAALTATCNGLSCSFDASASSDPDGSVNSWLWDFGDGETGTGKTVTHAYAAAGSYAVKLTVTDDKGASGEANQGVTPKAAPAGSVLAKDTFARVIAQGLGTADVGGPWTVLGAASRYSVSGGVGNWIMQGAGNAPGAYLKNVQAADSDLSFKVSIDKPATGGGVYLAAVGRSVANQGEYRAKVRFTSAGRMSLAIVRTTAAGVETYLTPETVVAGLTGTNSQQLGVRIQVTGQGTTAIKAKLWATSGAEPDAWQLEATDTTAELQAPGYTGVLVQLSGSATNAPVTARLSDFSLTTPR